MSQAHTAGADVTVRHPKQYCRMDVCTRDRSRRIEGYVCLVGFGLCVPQGPCLVPVAPGVMAPSGVLAIGLALVLRDLVQRRLGVAWALGAIGAGAALSAAFAPAALVVASTAAFLLSEIADLAVFTPLQRRGLVRAVAVSSFVGLVVDSLVFLWLAFGSLAYLPGQVIGKAWMVVLALPVIWLLRQRDARAS
jgi:uncharacterized PurR-regulated membrane protein YhhQ (DUF165 family)